MDIDYFGDERLPWIFFIISFVDNSVAAFAEFFILGDEVGCSLQFLYSNFFFVIH
jgi:hypothetical protein